MGMAGWCTILGPLYAGEEAGWVLEAKHGGLLLCADGGFAAALRRQLRPDLVIGDFDSMPPEAEAALQDIPVLRLPVLKDDTDMAVCLQEGRRRGFRRFRLLGALGGRLDHALANLQLISDCARRGEEAWIADRWNRATVLAPGAYTLAPMPGRKLSLLAATPEVTGVTVTGTRWTLSGARLTSDRPLGCSNEALSPEVKLRFDRGLLILCYSADPNSEEEKP